MNRHLTLLTVLAAGLISAPLASAQAPAAVPPAAIDAKIALVNFSEVVLASNEGQTVTLNTQKKYEPKKVEIEKLASEVDSLKKAIAALPANAPDDERASKLSAANLKEKELNSRAQEAQEAYNAEWQEALGKVAQKVAATMKTYAQTNGYTILLDVSSQSNSNVLWALPSTDISQAIVDAYNKASGVPAPPPPAPRPSPAARPQAAAPKK